MLRSRKEARPIYGKSSRPKGPCILTTPPDLNINKYLSALNSTLSVLEMVNNKQGALELLATIETTLTTVLSSELPNNP